MRRARRLAGRAQRLQAVRRAARGAGLAEVAQQVHRARGRPHRQLDARRPPARPSAPPGRDRLGDARQRVVVGHGQDRHPALRRQRDQRRGRQRPVGGDGVGVEVGPAGGGYAVTAPPMRPRASSVGDDRAPRSPRGVCDSVVMWTSGLSGASYGSLTPVNSLISPEKALA